jgi:hypothetical protein
MLSVVPKLKDKCEWARFERAMLNAAKRYGDVANSLSSREALSFAIDPSLAPTKSSVQFIEWEESTKILVRRKAKFAEDCRSFVSFLMDQLDSIMDRALRVEPDFDKLYVSDDASGLWKLLKRICTQDAVRRVGFQKHQFWNIKQSPNSSLNDYVLDFEHQLESLDSGGVVIPPEDQVIIFLAGLSTSFNAKVVEIRELKESQFPSAYLAVKEILSVRQFRRESRTNEMSSPSVFSVQADIVCFRCGISGHINRDCSVPSRSVLCSKCNGRGHLPQFSEHIQIIKAKVSVKEDQKIAAIEWDGEYVIG